MSKWKRRWFWFGAFVVLGGSYLWFFGAGTLFALNARRMGRQVPIINTVAADLQNLNVSRMPGEKLTFEGAEFEVPWDDIDRTRVLGKWVLISFWSGRSILLCVGAPDGGIVSMSKNKTLDLKLFAALYGPEVLQSDYALHQAIFGATPSQITLFTPEGRAAGLSMVLVIKAIMPPTTDWGIYNIQSNDFEGFQLGDPVRRPKKMSLELYAADIAFEINIDQPVAGPTPGIAQAEITRLIQTVRKAPHTQSILTIDPA